MSKAPDRVKWKPGKAVYSEWLKTLTKEEYEAHLQDRRARKEKKKLKEEMDALVRYNKNLWLSGINNALAKALHQAQITGDIDTVIKIYDRLVDDKNNNINISFDEPLPWNDDLD